MYETRSIAFLVLALALSFTSVSAQNDSQEKLRALRATKIAKPVFAKNGWSFDYDKARARARRLGIPILAYFTRSYAT